MLTEGEILRSILPIVTVTESYEMKTVSYCGTGFMIAPNTLVTCWSSVCNTHGDENKYAVLVKTGSGYSIHFLVDIEQHPDGLDLAVSKIDTGTSHYLRLYDKEILPGDTLVAYGYSPSLEQNMSGKISPSSFSLRFLHGSITRLFYYSKPGVVQAYTYEIDIPMIYGIYGAPLILPNTDEVVGIIFGAIDMPIAGGLARDEGVIGNISDKENQRITLGLAYHTDSLRSLLHMTTSRAESITPQRHDKNIDKEFGGTIVGLERSSVPSNTHESVEPGRIAHLEPDKTTDEFDAPLGEAKKLRFARASGKSKGMLDTILGATYKFAVFSLKEISKAFTGVVHVRKQFDRIHEAGRAREERAKAADIERLYRIVVIYEKRLNPEGLERLKTMRSIIEQLKLEYPDNKS
jgi:hypothetical protein